MSLCLPVYLSVCPSSLTTGNHCFHRSDHKELMEDTGDQQAGYSQCMCVGRKRGSLCSDSLMLGTLSRAGRQAVGSQAVSSVCL